MKKTLIVLFAIVLMAGLTSMAMAANITGSRHDFSSGGTVGAQGTGLNTTGEICNTCHVPHNPANPNDGPLWDHAVTASTTFTPYGDPSGSIDATDLDATLGQVSLLCLSCHDGSVAIDAFGGGSGTATITGAALISNDLSNDHPVSFTYDNTLATADGELATPAGGDVGFTTGLPLFGASNDQMECATCHNAHDGGATYFLRTANTQSALCKNCHSK